MLVTVIINNNNTNYKRKVTEVSGTNGTSELLSLFCNANEDSVTSAPLTKLATGGFQSHHGVCEQEANTGPVAGKTNRELSAPLQREQQRRSHHLQLG